MKMYGRMTMTICLCYLLDLTSIALTTQPDSNLSCGPSVVIFNCANAKSGGFCTPSSGKVFPSSENTNRSASFSLEAGQLNFANKTVLRPRSGPHCSSPDTNCCGDPCSLNPCLNNGTCTISKMWNETFTCSCTPEFQGDWCQIPVPTVTKNCTGCDSSAACVKGQCICNDGYDGDGTFCTGRCGALSIDEQDLYHMKTKCKNMTIHFNASYEGHTQESTETCGERALATIDCQFGTTAYDPSTLICLPCSESIKLEPVSVNISASEVEENVQKIALLTTQKGRSIQRVRNITTGLKSLANALKHDNNTITEAASKKLISTVVMKSVLIIVERLVSDISDGVVAAPTENKIDEVPIESEKDTQIREETQSVTDLIDDFARSVNMSGKEKIEISSEKTSLQINEPEGKVGQNHSHIFFQTTTALQSPIFGNVPRKQSSIMMVIPGEVVGDMHNHIHGENSTEKLKVVIAAFPNAKHLTSDPRTGPVVEACFRPGACKLDTHFATDFSIHYEVPPLPTSAQKSVTTGKRLRLHLEYFCVYWDRSTHSWSPRGCKFINNSNPESQNLNYTCSCNHFTSFSVLLRVTTELQPYHMHHYCLVLCAISAILLILTVLIYLIVKDLRNRRPTPIMVNVCVNLAAGFILFIIGMDGRSRGFGENTCFAFAVFMHLTFLFAWFWILIYSLNMYLALVKVVGSSSIVSKKLFMYVFGYVVPAIVVFMDLGISIALDRQPKQIEDETYESHYIASSICWVRGFSMYLGFTAPIGCILAINLIIFFLVMRKLTWKKSTIPSTKEKTTTAQQMFVAIAICSTMGLTWIFGYLMLISVDPNYHNVMETFFNVFNTSQGVVIFYVSCLRQKAVRRLWLYPIFRLCGCCKKTASASSSGEDVSPAAPPMMREGEVDTTAL